LWRESRLLCEQARRTFDESSRIDALLHQVGNGAASIAPPPPRRRKKLRHRQPSRILGFCGMEFDGDREIQELVRQLAGALEELRELEARASWGAELREAGQRVADLREKLRAARRFRLAFRNGSESGISRENGKVIDPRVPTFARGK
jgi:hypothetical protein